MSGDKNIIFMGSPDFSVPSLEAVHNEFGVKAVVTVPDKPKGRGRKLQPSPVKQKAEEHRIPVMQPEKLKDEKFIEEFSTYEPDIIVVVAFRILPPEIYEQARIGAFNIHASLLPKYRGAAPVNWAIINGETTTGVTSFLLQRKVDTGEILLQDSIDIPENTTAGDLRDMLMPKAAEMSVDTCRLLISGNYKTYPQDDSKAAPAPKIFTEECEINWNQHARNLSNFINGVSPIPGAWTNWEHKRLKILRSAYSSCGVGVPGEFAIHGINMTVQCGKGKISVLELQLQGKKPMKIQEFLQGWRGEKKGKFV